MKDMDWKKIDCRSQAIAQPRDGGPAFPLSQSKPDGWLVLGMSMRDYFAAAALQGRCAADWGLKPDDMAHVAYTLADAMLKEREKRQ